jgi:hypothetical protein
MVAEGERPKETVILVHGTWAAPVEGKHQWYQKLEGPGAEHTFVAKLDAALERHGSSARCWAHCDDKTVPYSWSGENSWLERTAGAANLGRYITRLASGKWHCHVVAHSHGGNVLMETLSQHAGALPNSTARSLGRLITLGTPFLNALAPIGRRRVAWFFVLAVPALLVAWSLAGFIASFIAEDINKFGLRGFLLREYNTGWHAVFVNIVAFFGLGLTLALPLMVLKQALQNNRFDIHRDAQKEDRTYRHQLLILNSNKDEAWQLLHHLSTMNNPLEPGTGLVRHLVAFWLRIARQKRQTARLLGIGGFFDAPLPVKAALGIFYAVLALWIFVPALLTSIPSDTQSIAGVTYMVIAAVLIAYYPQSFLSAVFAPIAFVWRQSKLIALMPSEVIAFLVRKRAWRVLQSAGLGLEAYPHQFPSVQQQPDHLPVTAVMCQNLNEDIVERVLVRRNQGMAKQIGSVTDILAKKEITMADASALLPDIETNISLIHAAYYTDDECIDRIAQWIAGKG